MAPQTTPQRLVYTLAIWRGRKRVNNKRVLIYNSPAKYYDMQVSELILVLLTSQSAKSALLLVQPTRCLLYTSDAADE